MEYKSLKDELTRFLEEDECNYIQSDDAMRDDLVGMRLFDAPIFRVADAHDPLFSQLRDGGALGTAFMFPDQWLPEAKSVISFFFPISERIRHANTASMRERKFPADEWLHCRIEGQEANDKFARHFCKLLIDAGYKAVAPSVDERLIEDIPNFTTNWSERHTAFICGHGTFGLSRGLITERGMAGRFGSVVTDLIVPPDERGYSGRYEYCVLCGKCAKNCPAGAIDSSLSPDDAKSHLKCIQFQGPIRNQPPRGKSQKVRYGCGLCQVDVPCEAGSPAMRRVFPEV